MTPSGSIRLFRLFGIRVYLHFTWFIVAAFIITSMQGRYYNPISAAYGYVGLFLIVLMHEFGHALACRQVGGRADQIVLWPLGGIAFVSPPPRAGAMLWSIVAGPLVNVALIPVFYVLQMYLLNRGVGAFHPDVYALVRDLAFVNQVILVFNLLPIYPLDGGQILRSLLWFPLGRVWSLKIASGLGVLGSAAVAAYAFLERSIWLGVLAFFLFSQASAGWQSARVLAEEEEQDRRLRDARPEKPVV
jgi:Zn-dependent protease